MEIVKLSSVFKKKSLIGRDLKIRAQKFPAANGWWLTAKSYLNLNI